MIHLAVIMVEYNSLTDVRECIASVTKAAAGVILTPLVVSNSEYSAESLERHKEEFGQKVFHSTHANLGYAGGVNFGLSLAPEAHFFLILNPDARWSKGSLAELLSTLQAQPDIGILGPNIVNDAGVRQPTARAFPSPLTALLTRTFLVHTRAGKKEFQRYFHSNMPSAKATQTPCDTDWVSGGAFIISKEAIACAGPMDDRYFMYMEDVDWCRTVWKIGLRVVHDTRYEACHAGKHESVNGEWWPLINTQSVHHIKSYLKYFLKWGRKSPPNKS